MPNNLKACPFCGSEAEKPYATDVRCNNAECSAHYFVTWMPAKVWNTRPLEDALLSRIAELEAAQRWIPVSERMPDDWESVLTIDISKSTRDMVTAFYNPETSLWSTPFSSDLWVTHWMPLPEPPIVYGKVCEE